MPVEDRMVEALILGPVMMRVDGKDVPLRSARQRAVVARLAIQAGEVVSVDALVESMWGEDPPSNAKGNLQSYVSRLRAVVGEDSVRFEHGGYRLAPAVGVDLHRVERHVAAARDRRRSGETAQALDEYRAAAAIWRGASLGDLADDLSFEPDAVRLDELRAVLMVEMLEAHLDAGSAASVLPDVRHWARRAPLHERSQLLLVRALHECGESADALRVAAAFRRRLADETGLDPGPELAALEQLVLAGPAETVPKTSTLPNADQLARERPVPHMDRFLGRDAECEQLVQMVAAHSLVTVTGPGGVGKSRLLSEVLPRLDPGSTVDFVDLGSALPGETVSTISSATGGRTGDDLAALVDHLTLRGSLLVIDSCEHVIEDVRRIASTLRRARVDARIVAASQIRLGIPGEQVLVLAPLGTRGDDPLALQLLCDRLAAQDPEFRLDDANTDALLVVCRRLDGLPLSLELAAAQVAALGIDGVAERLDDALDLLRAPVGASSERHTTLRRLTQWSSDQLGDDARRLADALSAFEGGFDLRAAEAVGSEVTETPVAGLVVQLVSASILLPHDRLGRRRYRMLESFRALGRERLADGGLLEAVRAAHAQWVVDVVAEETDRASGPDERVALQRLEVERANIRAALRWLTQAGATTMAGPLVTDLARSCLYRPDAEALAWLRAVADMETVAGSDEEAAICGAASRAAYLAGDLDACRDLARRAVDAAGDRPVDVAWHSLGVWHLYDGHYDAAVRWWSCTTDRPDAPSTARVDALGGIALAQTYSDRLAEAVVAAEAMTEIAVAIGHPTSIAWSQYVWGEVELRRNEDVAAAQQAFEVSTRLSREIGAEFIAGVAGIALLSLLVRNEDHAAVVDHAPPLLELLTRTATWPQLWTSMRLVAEYLAATGREDEARMILDAADRDPAAPSVVGRDARIHSGIGRDRVASSNRSALETVTSASPRAVVVRHVIDLLRQT